MYLLLSYDISSSPSRLRKMAKTCEKYGVRVQNSVFELDIDMAQLINLKGEIMRIIDKTCDSVRIYHMHKNFKDHIEIIGRREIVELSQDNGLFL